jgi:hypothetical protein
MGNLSGVVGHLKKELSRAQRKSNGLAPHSRPWEAQAQTGIVHCQPTLVGG